MDLYEWSKTSADRVLFGTGREMGSFTFYYLRNGRPISVFTVYTSGSLTLNYSGLYSLGERDALQQFHQALSKIPSLSSIPEDFSRWPSVKVAEAFLNRPESLGQFKEAVLKLGIRLNSPKAIEKGGCNVA